MGQILARAPTSFKILFRARRGSETGNPGDIPKSDSITVSISIDFDRRDSNLGISIWLPYRKCDKGIT